MKRLIIGLVFLLSAYPALGQKVEIKVDKNTDFSKYKTYFWVKGMPARNPIINKMITDTVDQQLSARGLTMTDAGGDLQVMFAAAVDLDLQETGVTWSNVSNPMGTLASIGPPMNITKGTLVVDLTDRQTERYVWRGIAKATLSRPPSGDIVKDAQSVEKLVKKSVAKMFDKYPVNK
jgi:Domain of unknown function (DUF4136)